MADVLYRQNLDFTNFEVLLDFALTQDNLLDEGASLYSAVVIALGTDALASDTDELPDLDSKDRRGWWGDMDADEIWGAWPVGCKLWLLERAKITGINARQGSTVDRADGYTRDALRPFVERSIASTLAVNAERTELERIEVRAVLFRGPNKEVDLLYSQLWGEL